jgi:Cu(I)/Ag(I) efflux system membrane protein CusA/SilA
VEIGVIMLVYLDQAWRRLLQDRGGQPTSTQLVEAVLSGAGRRIRPVMMTSATIILGLLPIMLGSGTGTEIMQRIAAPLVGGMASAVVLTLLVLPTVYLLWRRRGLPHRAEGTGGE